MHILPNTWPQGNLCRISVETPIASPQMLHAVLGVSPLAASDIFEWVLYPDFWKHLLACNSSRKILVE